MICMYLREPIYYGGNGIWSGHKVKFCFLYIYWSVSFVSGLDYDAFVSSQSVTNASKPNGG